MEDLSSITPGFCPNCGSILPHLRPTGKVRCYNCLTDWPPEGMCYSRSTGPMVPFLTIVTNSFQSNWETAVLLFSFFVAITNNNNMIFFSVFGAMKTEFTIHFNTYAKRKQIVVKQDEDEGPVVERVCPKCGNEKMSYATLQLRSADEGQTVFYTCTACKYVLWLWRSTYLKFNCITFDTLFHF